MPRANANQTCYRSPSHHRERAPYDRGYDRFPRGRYLDTYRLRYSTSSRFQREYDFDRYERERSQSQRVSTSAPRRSQTRSKCASPVVSTKHHTDSSDHKKASVINSAQKVHLRTTTLPHNGVASHDYPAGLPPSQLTSTQRPGRPGAAKIWPLAPVAATYKPFPLLQLPVELQEKILTHHLNDVLYSNFSDDALSSTYFFDQCLRSYIGAVRIILRASPLFTSVLRTAVQRHITVWHARAEPHRDESWFHGSCHGRQVPPLAQRLEELEAWAEGRGQWWSHELLGRGTFEKRFERSRGNGGL